MKKKIIISFLFVLIIATMISVPSAKSRVKSYYNGDAINYNGLVVVGSTNMTGLEIFKLENNTLFRMVRIRSFRAQYGGFDDFYNFKFNIEDGILYAYVVDGTYLYKYDLTDLSYPKLVKQIKDNSWDWFRGVNIENGRLVTLGGNGIKIWNPSLQVIDSFKISIKNFNNVTFSQDGQFIYIVEGKNIKIFDTKTRTFVRNIEITSVDDHNRKIYVDNSDGSIYIADDKMVKRFDFDGGIIKSFKHVSDFGYDVARATNGNYLYFTDGIGIVKLRKDDLKPIKWLYTNSLVGKTGWAMGVNVVNDGNSDKVIVFNNTHIIALDNNLKLIGQYKSNEEDVSPIGSLFLKVDKTRASVNSQVSLIGGGYGQNEDLMISFAGIKTAVKADNKGNFSNILTVPAVKAGGYDIRVDGTVSGQSYSVGFNIE
jgi:hypothetical protein